MPWGAHLSTLYERYKILRMSFDYEPNCASTTVGSVILSPSYDAVDGAPETFEDATSKLGAVHGQAWTAMQCNIDPNRVHAQMKMLNTRRADVSGTDIKTYDGGNLHLCVTDCATDGSLIGRLSVEYTIELATPVGATESLLDMVDTNTSGLSATNLIGDCSDATGSMQTEWDGTTNYIQVPGEYLVVLRVAGTGLTAPFTNTASDGTWNSIFSFVDAAATTGYYVVAARLEDGDAFCPRLTGATTVTSCTTIVTQAHYDDFADY
jgi:hypothetical protein